MKSFSFFAIVACLLNVSLESSSSYVKLKPSQVALYQKDYFKPLRPSFKQQQQKCYDTFTSRVNYAITEIKISTNSCVNAADLKFQIGQKLKLMQGFTEKCSLEPNIVQYFTCVKTIKADSKNILDEILMITENFSKNFKQIEQNKTACFIEAFEKGKYKSISAHYDLNLCLQNIHQSTLPKPTEYPSVDNQELLNDLNTLKLMYANLQTCYRYMDSCWEQVFYEKTLSESSPDFIKLLSDHFEKLTEIDKAEDSCLRQFILIFTSYKRNTFKFELETCLSDGYSAVIQSEENEDKDMELINGIKNVHNSFNSCRVISKDLDTRECVFKKLDSNNSLYSELQSKISIKSEKNLKKLSEIIEYLYTQHWPCIASLFSTFQFNGMNLKPIERGRLTDCLLKGHKSPTLLIITKDDILADLKNVQDVIKSCTVHPDSPGFERCFKNTVDIYGGNLLYIRTKYDNYEALVNESDKINHTCFGGIIELSQYFSISELAQLEKCIINKLRV